VLKQIVKGFELALHGKKKKILLKEGFLVCKVSGISFPSTGI
jgi:hypothetical protein